METANTTRKCNICEGVVVKEIAEYVSSLERSRYSPKSIDTYRRALLDLDGFLAETSVRRAEDVTAATLSDYRLSMVERGFRPASQEVYLRAVKGLFRMLESRRRIFINPAADLVARQAPQPVPRVPSERDVRMLLEAPDTATPYGLRDRAILETAYATGARRRELASITLASVDLAGRTARLMGKGNRERIVPLTLCAAAWLGRYIGTARLQLCAVPSDRLWLGRRGPLTHAAIYCLFVAHCRAAGLDPVVGPHDMRRACATHMLRNGASPVEIQQLLGHADLSHLSRYLAVSISEMRRAHAKSRLGA